MSIRKNKQAAQNAVKAPVVKREPLPLSYAEILAAQGLVAREQELKRDGDQLVFEVARRNKLDPNGYGKDYAFQNGFIVFIESLTEQI